jgi:uncharacterized membrane protein
MLYLIVVSSVILLVLDSIFLSLNSKVFGQQVFDVQRYPLKLNFMGAVPTYLLLIFAVNYFILIPKRSVLDAFFLGVVIYGVFEGTNLSIFKNWKLATVVLDTLWGGVLMAATTYLTYTLTK